MREGARGQRRAFWATAGLVVTFCLVAAQGAWGAAITDEEELGQFGSKGAAAGQLEFATAIATDPGSGHVFLAGSGGNNRIDEFTPWGAFVKAFGWDVAPGAVNEQQEVRVRAAEGDFTLSFGGDTTADLPLGAGKEEVEEALNALSSIGTGGVEVEEAPGAVSGKTPYVYVVIFNGAAFEATDVAQLEAANGTQPLSGGVPSTSLEVRTRADGHAETTGLEACTAESGCKAGLEGTGAGQLRGPRAQIAIGPTGRVYVSEMRENHRVQVFDPAGRFVLMFGGEVDKTTKANRCTKANLEGGDVCGVGITGTGNGQFSQSNFAGLAFNSAGKLFVGDKERIQRFNSEGEFEAACGPVTGVWVHDLAIAPGSGDFYASVGDEGGTEEYVRRLVAATCKETGKLQAEEIEANPASKATGAPFATNPAGEIFALRGNVSPDRILEFDAAEKQISELGMAEKPLRIWALGTNGADDLYAAYSVPGGESFVRFFGPPPVTYEGPPKVPPTITEQFASSVQRDGATLAVKINPRYFTDTHYFLQYGTGECRTGGCPETAPVPPGPLLTPKVTITPVAAQVSLGGLTPGTTYHYRFVAESSGGGPVYGVDPDGEGGPKEASEAEGEEGSFTTYQPLGGAQCENQALRGGPAAGLPDCRAYEMVSPVDKNGGDILTLPNSLEFSTALEQSAPGGERFTYSSYRSFGEPEGAPRANQYLASRDAQSGWSSKAIDAPQRSRFGTLKFENPYKAFSEDLCEGWLVTKSEPPLAAGASEGFNNLYRREECGAPEYEALTPGEPQSGEFFPILEGSSADGDAALVMAKEAPGAPSGALRTYQASGGGLVAICILPDGSESSGNCSGGTGHSLSLGNSVEMQAEAALSHALSEDGSKAYWTAFDASVNPPGPGKVYLRLNPGEEQSALNGEECTEAEKACTLAVSETQTSEAAEFLGASADGERALFKVVKGPLAGKLYQYEAGGGSSEIAAEVVGVAAASEDLSRIYFASREAIAGTSGASAGKPNLYLDEEGAMSFIATLSEKDVASLADKLPSDTNPAAVYHAARATADGGTLTFISTAPLAEYDNRDQVSGEADSEVYLYEAGASEAVCVSCNPGGARPAGRKVLGLSNSLNFLPTAASLAMPTTTLYVPRALSADGGRLFFNSFDALLPRDNNGVEDAYEWEKAPSREACEALGAEAYVPASGGCLSLISSGQSPEDSEFLEASEDGGDAFFTTGQSLLPRDPGLFDVYDARVGGGIAEPVKRIPCLGETCQPSVAPPEAQTPSSSSYEGPEDKSPSKKKHKKNKKHHKHKHHKKHQHKRRAGR